MHRPDAPLRVTAAALPALRESRGRVVNVASVAAYTAHNLPAGMEPGLLTLVDTLLDFSRLQAGRVRARFEPVEPLVRARDAGLMAEHRTFLPSRCPIRSLRPPQPPHPF